MKAWLFVVVCSFTFLIMLIPPDSVVEHDELTTDDAPVQGRSIGDYATGGYHLVSGEWWDKPVGYRPTVEDIDGDGLLSPFDTHSLDPSMPPLFTSGSEGLILRAGDPDWKTYETDHYTYGAFGDVDGDGDLDLVLSTGEYGTRRIQMFENQKGTFADYPTWISPESAEPNDMRFADFNQDGRMDLALSDPGSPLSLYAPTARSMPSTVTWQSESQGWSYPTYSSLAIADFDNDTYLDLFAGVTGGKAELRMNRLGTLERQASWYGNSSLLTGSTEVADMDNDGDPDIVSATWDEGIIIYRNNDGSLNRDHEYLMQNVTNVTRAQTLDANDDGWLDLLVTSHLSKKSAMLFLSDAGSFNETPDWTDQEPNKHFHSVVGDVDGDLKEDVLLFVENITDPIRIHRWNEGAYPHSADWSTNLGTDTMHGSLADIDLDGDLDLLLVQPGSVGIIFNRPQPRPVTVPSWTSDDAMSSVDVTVMDLNGDGVNDLVFANEGPSRGYCGLSGGGFNTTPCWETSSLGGLSVTAGDIDQDGDDDLVLGRYFNSSFVFLSEGGNLTSEPSLEIDQGNHTWFIDLLDYDGDGDLDLYQALTDRSVNILEWDSGVFQTTPVFEHFRDICGQSGFDIGDFDADGDDDMVVTYQCGVTQIFEYQGSDSANTTLWSVSSGGDEYPSLYDFDADGDLDLTIVRFGMVLLFENDGTNISTQPLWSHGHGKESYRAHWGDINDDGLDDLIVTTASNCLAFFRTADGLPPEPSWKDKVASNSIRSLLLDVDDDGRIDYVTANRNKNEIFDFQVALDSDLDGTIDVEDDLPSDPTQISDPDGDGFGDLGTGTTPDDCRGQHGSSWRDRWGCPDADGDGQSDLGDDYWRNATQWSDTDGDGLGDNWPYEWGGNERRAAWPGIFIEDAYLPDPSPLDYDNDGYEDPSFDEAISPLDDCPLIAGTSTIDREGCLDSDGDGYSDPDDEHAVIDGADAFPSDPTQWTDTDGDGYGDAPAPAARPDGCPTEVGESYLDVYGCPDGDEDGYGTSDDCPEDSGTSTQDLIGCLDIDGDGWSTLNDLDDLDITVWSDVDGDGYADQMRLGRIDSCPNVVGNSTKDRFGCLDSDGDGYSNADGLWPAHPIGLADSHPLDATQWQDTDGDQWGDQSGGNDPDMCPEIMGQSRWIIVDGIVQSYLGCADADGDGMSDETDDCPSLAGTSTRQTRSCPDTDLDGLEDRLDDCPSVAGTSWIHRTACMDSDGDGVPDLDDIEPFVALETIPTEEDWDGDGRLNGDDVFPFDETQWVDADGDGLGDASTGRNADPYPDDRDNDGVVDALDACPDDPGGVSDLDGDGICDQQDDDTDGDGVADVIEIQEGSNHLSAESMPEDSFALYIPRTSISLDAWDLIQFSATLPALYYFLYAFGGRGVRVRRLEQELEEVSTPDDLTAFEHRLERMVRLRFIAPYQAIRLERERSRSEARMSSGLRELDIDEDLKSPPASYMKGWTQDDGWEWIDYPEDSGTLYYRQEGSDDEWTLHQG